MTVFLGIDLGGTTIEGLAVDDNGEPIMRTIASTRVGSAEAVMSSVVDLVDSLTTKLDEPPAAIGLGVPGIVEPASGTVRHALNLGIDAPFPIGSRLSDHLSGLPVVVENDVRMAAIGAHRHLAQPDDSLVYLGLGTGVAAGIIIDGELHRGSTGMAGEIGHSSFAPSVVECRCGRVGCLEAVASGPAIRAIWAGENPAEDLFRLALGGQSDAVSAAMPVVEHLASAIDDLVRMIDPSFVVLGGGVGTSSPALHSLLINQFAGMADNVLLSDSDLQARLHQLPSDWPAGAQGASWIARNTTTQEG
ncbi:MAG: ROK family protein [Actinomycetia bacterium]|nr:ROK family protein [Actinomycetes bacterium]MCP4960101.1 ROK family protein [Actinomycetes bacterium]